MEDKSELNIFSIPIFWRSWEKMNTNAKKKRKEYKFILSVFFKIVEIIFLLQVLNVWTTQ